MELPNLTDDLTKGQNGAVSILMRNMMNIAMALALSLFSFIGANLYFSVNDMKDKIGCIEVKVAKTEQGINFLSSRYADLRTEKDPMLAFVKRNTEDIKDISLRLRVLSEKLDETTKTIYRFHSIRNYE